MSGPVLREPDRRLVEDLERMLAPERVLSRPIDRLGRSADASIYRLIPEAIVRPRGLGEVESLFAWARQKRRHLTFRTAGTSLSGQAVTDDVLVELGPFFRSARVLDDGARVVAQPGVVGGHLNRLLAGHGKRIGPDPASIDTAMIGGILANNSSGMCCGVAQNSYHTLDGLQLLLAGGAVVDTREPDADAQLKRGRPALHAELLALRDEIRRDAALAGLVRRKFLTKNTSGYSLNAFLDYDEPAQILAHLMVGSEGTLGFVAELTLRTVPEPPARATALVFFAELEEAGRAVAPLARAGSDALEILDAGSLRSIASEHPLPFEVEDQHAALLVELRRADDGALASAVDDVHAILRRHRLIEPASFTTGQAERAALWHLRKGLATRMGAMRPSGTAFLTEDVAVPVARLAEAIRDFQALFVRHGVGGTAILGHAKDGNLHFVLAEDVRNAEAVERYGAFMHGLVELVVGKYDGAIKAEHGSGRNMAPFVKREWGERAYATMERVKRLLDPDGILSPGVLLNPNPRCHLEHLKPPTPISPLADRCIECGYCEPRCPSRDLTLTPRQRIVVTRELVRLRGSSEPADAAWLHSLERDFAYDGIETCAGDSMCQAACPVKIDTGALVKELRAAGALRGVERRRGRGRDAFRPRREPGAGRPAHRRGGPRVAARGPPGRARVPGRERLRPGPAAAASARAGAAGPCAEPLDGRAAPCRSRAQRRLLPELFDADDRPAAGRERCSARAGHARGARLGRLRRAGSGRDFGALLRHGFREQRLLRGGSPRGAEHRGGALARDERRPAGGGDRRLALRGRPRRGRGRDPARDASRDPHARLSGLLGARGAALARRDAAARGDRHPAPDLHAREGGRARRPAEGGARARGEGRAAGVRRVLRLRRRQGLPGPRADGERYRDRGRRGAPAARARPGRRLLLDLPDLRDRHDAGRGPLVPPAARAGARGRHACLSGCSTRSRRCRSSPPICC